MEQNGNIVMKLNSVNEVKYMMMPDAVPSDISVEDLRLGFSNNLQPDIEHDILNVVFGVQYAYKGNSVLESVYRFSFSVINLKQFITFNENNSITVSRIMPFITDITLGTMRGILVVKTAGTNLAQLPIPIIDPKQLNANLAGRRNDQAQGQGTAIGPIPTPLNKKNIN